MGAPPAQAPSAQSATRKTKAAAGTMMTAARFGARKAARVGSAAPTEGNRRRPGRLDQVRLSGFVKAKLVARMGVERVLGHEPCFASFDFRPRSS
jgi:hypothetical protein